MRSWQWALALYDHVPVKRVDMDTFTHADGDPCVELEAKNQAMLLLDTGDGHKTPSGWESRELLPPMTPGGSNLPAPRS